MFNSPILDVTIGLVLIYLLYSLLATTINELIAMLFGLRARMLRTAIKEHILANTGQGTKGQSIRRGFSEFATETARVVGISSNEDRTVAVPKNVSSLQKIDSKVSTKIGEQFFDHPVIRSYGASGLFPIPSYIPTRQFSSVLVDLLLKEYQKVESHIIEDRLADPGNTLQKGEIQKLLSAGNELGKISELIRYYERHYIHQDGSTSPLSILDKDTWGILQLQLRESIGDMNAFVNKLETWFDDSMNRVSGWYKRQTQAVLFCIGLVMALSFNVNTIQITTKLSQDEKARENMVALAVKAAETYKDDPRVKRDTATTPASPASSYQLYQHKLDSLAKKAQLEAEQARNVLVGMSDDESGFLVKLLGCLITAIAICLGAPFWFDLLNKLVKVRGTGNKEGSAATTTAADPRYRNTPPIVIQNVTRDEAVG